MELHIKDGPNGQRGGTPFPEAAREMEAAGVANPGMLRLMAVLPQRMLARNMRKAFGFDNKDIATRPLESGKHVVDGPNGPVRLSSCKPADGPAAKEGLPVLVYFHGGGWVAGSVGVVENICRGIASLAGCLVFNVDYRLAPEHKFPAGLEDCYAAFLWVARHAASLGGDPARIFLAGDSAGGNFATICTLLARERQGPPIRGQILVYPAVDLSPGPDGDPASNPLGAVIPRLYLRDRRLLRDARVSPLHAADLGGLPPAFVITAEYCFIRDQGEAYARRLDAAGVPVRALRYNGLGHAFLDKVGVWPQADACIADIAAWIRETAVNPPARP